MKTPKFLKSPFIDYILFLIGGVLFILVILALFVTLCKAYELPEKIDNIENVVK